MTAISEYFKYLEQEGVLSPGESSVEVDYDRQLQWLKSQGVEVAGLTRQQILEYQTASWVFIKCRGRLTDAMEDFEIQFDALGYRVAGVGALAARTGAQKASVEKANEEKTGTETLEKEE